MEGKIREYIEGIFADVGNSQKAYELQEEMILNLIEKYHDLVNEGKSPEVAYNITIASIGDVSELIQELEDEPMNRHEQEQYRKKSAQRVSIAVMLYILSVVPLIVLSALNVSDTIGIVIMFLMIAAATGLLIYNGMIKPKYMKNDDTMVEDFKEWQSNKTENNASYRSINGAVWALTVALYFLVSFATGAWHITWVIFIISVAVTNIIKAVFDLKRK